ncbi:MAG: sulfite exporter TauE/SafE family protein [bacterium]|nr:sulfite exporter TauE/SafE family protein [bacterium]
MTEIFWLAPILAGLLGTPHCMGMCGPIVAGYSSCLPRQSHHAFWHLGRLSTYLFLGAIWGLLGFLVDQALPIQEIHSVAGLIGGLLLVGFGVRELGGFKALRIHWSLPGLNQVTSWAFRRPKPLNLWLLGLGSGFLPCVVLFPVQTLALSTGDPFAGAAVFGLFWVGTLPGLLGIGLFSGLIRAKLSRRFRPLWGVGLVALGLAVIVLRVQQSSGGTFCTV